GRTIRTDRQADRAADLEVRAGRRAQVRRRLAQIAQLDVVPTRELDELRIVSEPNVEAVLEVETVRDTRPEQRAPVRGKAAALRDDTDEGGVGVEGERVLHASDDRDAVLRLPHALRVEDRAARLAPVAY